MPNSVFRIPVLMQSPPYDPMEDFTWIVRMVGYTFGIVVRADAPWQTLQGAAGRRPRQPGQDHLRHAGAWPRST
jgi:tripartite-type tricarboxylate transporter receptor subunit TctC